MSAFNYRKKQQERRSVLAMVGRSGGRGQKWEETNEKGETRIVFALNPATAAPGAATDAALSYNKAARRDKGTGGEGRREEGNEAVPFMQKYAEFSPKWPTGYAPPSTSGRPRRPRNGVATPASRGFNSRKLHASSKTVDGREYARQFVRLLIFLTIRRVHMSRAHLFAYISAAPV